MDISKIAKDVRVGSDHSRKLKLLGHQKKHFKRIVGKILTYSEGYIDGSDMGKGKTITACAISIYYKLPLFVICPRTIIKVWEDAIDAFGLEYYEIISYERLVGRKNTKHEYLTRDVNSHYRATEYLVSIIERGALFIFDECQFIKSYHTARFKACHCITKEIIGTVSRYGILSGTPFDKVTFAISMVKLLNIMTDTQLYTKRRDTSQVYLLGLQEVIDYAYKIDAVKTKKIIDDNCYSLTYKSINRRLAETAVYMLYDEVIKNYIGSSIEGKELCSKINVYNGFFKVDDDGRETLIKYIDSFEDAALPIIDDNDITLNSLTRINKLRYSIEYSKLHIFARLAIEKLEIEGSRVAIALCGIKAIKELSNILERYNPLVLIGETKNRGDIIDLYQDPNSNRRLLIMNIKLGQGINLHDLVGGRDTHVYISPNYSIIDIIQTIGRFYREGVLSDTDVYIVYTNIDGRREHKIISALIEKSKAVKGSVPNYNSKYRIPLPEEFKEYIEY